MLGAFPPLLREKVRMRAAFLSSTIFGFRVFVPPFLSILALFLAPKPNSRRLFQSSEGQMTRFVPRCD
jgi:hypothetical protein